MASHVNVSLGRCLVWSILMRVIYYAVSIDHWNIDVDNMLIIHSMVDLAGSVSAVPSKPTTPSSPSSNNVAPSNIPPPSSPPTTNHHENDTRSYSSSSQKYPSAERSYPPPSSPSSNRSPPLQPPPALDQQRSSNHNITIGSPPGARTVEPNINTSEETAAVTRYPDPSQSSINGETKEKERREQERLQREMRREREKRDKQAQQEQGKLNHVDPISKMLTLS